jgi:hypothetical protein
MLNFRHSWSDVRAPLNQTDWRRLVQAAAVVWVEIFLVSVANKLRSLGLSVSYNDLACLISPITSLFSKYAKSWR